MSLLKNCCFCHHEEGEAGTARRLWLVCSGLLLILILGAGPAPAQPPKIRVAASILPLADFCRQIGGDRVEVQVLIPPGASPHTFEPSPGTLRGLSRAQILVYIGNGLEPWIERFQQARNNPKQAVVVATRGLDLIMAVPVHVRDGEGPGQQQCRHQEAGRGGCDNHGAGNPHVWLDPVLAQAICRQIAEALIEKDPVNRAVYAENLEHYLEKLRELQQQIAAATAGFRLREFVGFHPSFTYFARRFNLQEVGIIEVAPGREPTPRAFKKIIDAIQHYGIKVIFSEPQFSPRIAEVLAAEAGVSVLALDPIGGRPPYGDNYLKMMQYNLETMALAMK